jgi:hypothetical protein
MNGKKCRAKSKYDYIIYLFLSVGCPVNRAWDFFKNRKKNLERL